MILPKGAPVCQTHLLCTAKETVCVKSDSTCLLGELPNL